MSRIGKQPVSIPDKVKVTVNDGTVLVEGPKGKVQKSFASAVKVTVGDKKVTFAPTEESRFAKAMYGTARSVVAGMGYRADITVGAWHGWVIPREALTGDGANWHVFQVAAGKAVAVPVLQVAGQSDLLRLARMGHRTHHQDAVPLPGQVDRTRPSKT